jgi:hypothetical protein
VTVFSMPCLAVGRDRSDGMPLSITIPGGARRKVPLVVGSETVGWVEPDGNVLLGDLSVVKPATARMLAFVKHNEGRFKAVIHDGAVAAVVVTRR